MSINDLHKTKIKIRPCSFYISTQIDFSPIKPKQIMYKTLLHKMIYVSLNNNKKFNLLDLSVALIVATAQWSLTSFANTLTDEYL